jgi:hypothetical protein
MFMRGILHTIFMVQSKVEPQNSDILDCNILSRTPQATYHRHHLVPPPGVVIDNDDNDARGYQLCAVAPPIAAIAVVSPLRRPSPSRRPLPSSLLPSSPLSPSSPSSPSSLLPSPLRRRCAFCRRCVDVMLSIAVAAIGRRAVWPRRFGPPCCCAATAVAAKPPPCCPCNCRAATTSAALPPPPPC